MEQVPEASLVSIQSTHQENVKYRRAPVRRGEACPRCGVGRLDYNGLLDMECPFCGYSEGSGAGCT